MKKAILIFIGALMMAQAQAQTNPVMYDGTSLYSAGGTGAFTNFAQGISGYFEPSFGAFTASVSPFLYAEGYTLTNAALTSGTITNTWEENGTYLVFGGAGTLQGYLYYTNGGRAPRLFTFHGRHDGLAPNTVKFLAYNFTAGVYSNFTADADDLNASTTDSTLQFTFPAPNTNYSDANGATWIRIEKTGATDTDIFIDLAQLTFASGVATNAGTWYPLAGGFDSIDATNITINTTNTTITTTSAGRYQNQWAAQFTGETNTTFRIRMTTNNVSTGKNSTRTIGGTPQIGSMSAIWRGWLPIGTVVGWEFSATTDGAWLAIEDGTAVLEQRSK